MIRNFPDSFVCGYSSRGKTAAVTAPTGKQLAVFNARAYNNSGASTDVGVARLLNNQYRLWQLQSSAFTEVTGQLSGGKQIFTTSDNDGFVIQSTRRIGMIGFTISSASGSGVFTYSYSSSATAFSSLTTLSTPTDYSSAADTWVVFRPPVDWVTGGNASLDANMYSIKFLATTHPTSAVSINNLWLAEFLDLYSGVANNAAVQVSFPDSKPFILGAGEGLIPYFTSSNSANSFGAFFASIDG